MELSYPTPLFSGMELPDAVRINRLDLSGCPQTGIILKNPIFNEETKVKVSRLGKSFFVSPEPQVKHRPICRYAKCILLSALLLPIFFGALLIVSPILIPIFMINLIASSLLLLTKENYQRIYSRYAPKNFLFQRYFL